MVVRRIAPLSAAKVAGVTCFMVGLPFALLVWLVSMVGLNYSGLSGSPFLPFPAGYIVAGGAVAVLIIPLVYGAFYFVMALVGTGLYNIVARLVGGVSVELEDIPKTSAGDGSRPAQ